MGAKQLAFTQLMELLARRVSSRPQTTSPGWRTPSAVPGGAASPRTLFPREMRITFTIVKNSSIVFTEMSVLFQFKRFRFNIRTDQLS